MKGRNFRSAFTLIEAIFVIVVFGIVAAISSEIYAKVYENYLLSRVMNRLESKTELVLETVATRLQYRIKSSTIARKNDLTTIINASDPSLDEDYRILEWIGYDYDGYLGDGNDSGTDPAWSGLIDLDNSTRDTYVTPASRLDVEQALIAGVTNSRSTFADAGIVFVGAYHDYRTFGWYDGSGTEDNSSVLNIGYVSATQFNLTESDRPLETYEQYRLVYSAYAIAPDPLTCTEDCNLSLYTDYQPWLGERFEVDGTKRLLAEKVSTFKFRQVGEVFRLKICLYDFVVEKRVSVCKEKVVF